MLTITAAALIVAASAWVQGSVGFGYALLSAPLLALIDPSLVPGPVMLSSMLLSAASGYRERKSIDWRGLSIALAGRFPGVVLGGLALAWLSAETMSVVFGVVVLAGVAMSVSGAHFAETPATLTVAGFASGVMGTMTAIGGPPIALVYQHAEGPKLRSTLSTYFALGSAMSIPALALAGYFDRDEVPAAIAMLPATAIGFAVSSRTRGYVDNGRTRAAVLAVASLSALAVVVRGMLA
jgi:uncharacterized membrane protein YfcA